MRRTRKWRPGLGIFMVSVATLLPLVLGQGCPEIDISGLSGVGTSLGSLVVVTVSSPSVA